MTSSRKQVAVAVGLGEMIRRRRLELGLSRSETARRAGLCRNALIPVEDQDRTPSLVTAAKLARALDMFIDLRDLAPRA